jgi:hypothetical protein
MYCDEGRADDCVAFCVWGEQQILEMQVQAKQHQRYNQTTSQYNQITIKQQQRNNINVTFKQHQNTIYNQTTSQPSKTTSQYNHITIKQHHKPVKQHHNTITLQ